MYRSSYIDLYILSKKYVLPVLIDISNNYSTLDACQSLYGIIFDY